MSLIFPVPEDTRERIYVAAAAQTDFAVPYPFQRSDDLTVAVKSVGAADFVDVAAVDYTVTGAGDPAGGTISLNVGLAVNDEIRIRGAAVLERLTSIVRAGKYNSAALDQDLDRQLIISQELARAVSAVEAAQAAAGGGDMAASVYDPTAVAGDAFDMDNMVEGAATKILTDTERTKLAGIETGATADQTGAEIKAAYEAEPSAFTDAQFTKLSGIATGATANDTDANLKARANHTGTQVAATISDFSAAADARITASAQATATWEAGVGTTESAVSPAKVAAAIAALASGGGDMFIATYDPTAVSGDAFAMDNMVEGATTKILTGTERTKLSGIETGATADQTGAEIKTAYEAEPSAFTDAQFTKLAGIATGATANDTDANLKARANHTGTQTASTISDFNSAADARITAATGVSVQAYDADTAKTNVAQSFTALQSSSVETMTDGATITPTGDKNAMQVTLGGNRTIANMTTITAGTAYVFKIIQDATGSRTVSWGSAYDFPGGTAPTLSTAANAVDVISGFSFDGTSIQMFTPGQDFS